MICVAGALALLWRALRRSGRDVEGTLVKIGTQLAGIDEKIGAAVGGPDRRRSELGPTIGETLDLDEVLGRTLAAAHAVGPVDGGRIAVRLADGTMATATSGPVVDVAGGGLQGPPDGSAYTYGSFAWEVPDGSGLRAGLAVPVAGGALSVFSRMAGAFDVEAAATLSAIARRAEPAVRNALEHRAVLERAAKDLLTGLGSASAFAEALPRELAIARRRGRPFCMIQIDLDDFSKINNDHPRKYDAGNDALAGFGRRLLATIRTSDSAFRNSGGADEFFLLLPETSREEAKLSYARIAFEMAAAPFGDVGPVTMSSGLVELSPDDTEATLKSRVGRLVGEAKRRGKNQLVSDDEESA